MLAGHIAIFSGKTATLPPLQKCGCPYQVVQFFLYIPNANLFSPTFTPMPSAIFFISLVVVSFIGKCLNLSQNELFIFISFLDRGSKIPFPNTRSQKI